MACLVYFSRGRGTGQAAMQFDARPELLFLRDPTHEGGGPPRTPRGKERLLREMKRENFLSQESLYEQLQVSKRDLAAANDENRKLRTDIRRMQALLKRKDADIKG